MKVESRSGFTLVEIMIVVGIIGLLAVVAIPSFMRSRMKSRMVAVAADLKVFDAGFQQYAMDYGDFPNDVPAGVLPPGMGDYFKAERWLAKNKLGVHYNWEGPNFYVTYAGISFEGLVPLTVLLEFDQMIDDGSLTTGQFRQTPNMRYTYIVEKR